MPWPYAFALSTAQIFAGCAPLRAPALACLRAAAMLCVSAPAETVARIGLGMVGERYFWKGSIQAQSIHAIKPRPRQNPNEFRLLHHHGGAVFLVARRQRAAR